MRLVILVSTQINDNAAVQSAVVDGVKGRMRRNGVCLHKCWPKCKGWQTVSQPFWTTGYIIIDIDLSVNLTVSLASKAPLYGYVFYGSIIDKKKL